MGKILRQEIFVEFPPISSSVSSSFKATLMFIHRGTLGYVYFEHLLGYCHFNQSSALCNARYSRRHPFRRSERSTLEIPPCAFLATNSCSATGLSSGWLGHALRLNPPPSLKLQGSSSAQLYHLQHLPLGTIPSSRNLWPFPNWSSSPFNKKFKCWSAAEYTMMRGEKTRASPSPGGH